MLHVRVRSSFLVLAAKVKARTPQQHHGKLSHFSKKKSAEIVVFSKEIYDLLTKVMDIDYYMVEACSL